jgi:hypothetical protein
MAWLQLLVPMAWLLSPYCVVSHVLETKSGEIHEVQHHHHHHHDASCTSTPWGPWEKCHKVGYYEGGAYAPFFRTCNGEMYARREVYGANCKAANKKRKFCTIAPEDCELEPQAPGGTDNHASGFNVQAWTNKKPVLIEGVRHTVSGTDEIDAKSCEYGGQRVRHGWSGAGIGKRYRCETCTCVFGEMECMEDADRCSLDDPYHPRFCSHTGSLPLGITRLLLALTMCDSLQDAVELDGPQVYYDSKPPRRQGTKRPQFPLLAV